MLKGKGSHAEFTGITFAGKGQNLDTGAKMIHIGEDTSSFINTKSISKDGGISTYRSSVTVNEKAKNAKASVSCASLMLDDISRSDTVPAMDIRTGQCDIGHEAKIGRISDDAVFYLMSRGISEEDAKAMIVVLPRALASTTPLSDTDTIDSSPLFQIISLFVAFSGYTVALIAAVFPTSI